jgi:hypothetical protein
VYRAASLNRESEAAPVVQSTSFSGISCLARSMKFCPAATHRENMFELELLQLGHNLAQIGASPALIRRATSWPAR